MKILFINDSAVPIGGAEMLTLMLRDAFESRGHDVRLFAADADNGIGRGDADVTCFGTHSALQAWTRTANVSAARRLHRLLRRFEPDVVLLRMFLTQLSPLILPVLRDYPCVYHVDEYGPVCPTGTKTLPSGEACESRYGRVCRQGCVSWPAWPALMAQMALLRRWRSCIDMIAACSRTTADLVARDGLGPVEVLWSGSPHREPREALRDPPTVGFAGRLRTIKGVDVALRAFARVLEHVPEARFTIAGHGPEDQRWQTLAAELNVAAHVDWLGHLERDELERRFDRLWVQIVPSVWREPFGLVATEAMMRGTAVIASDTGGLSEIVLDERTGYLVPPGDVDQLADRMTRVLADRPLAERLGHAGRQRALEQFSCDRMVERLLACFDRVRTDRRKPTLACTE